MLPFHRAGHASRGRAFGELLLAVLIGFVLIGVLDSVERGVYGVKKLKELPRETHTILTFLNIAAMGPAAMLAARLSGRNPRTMLSVVRRIRWRWLATCLLVALAVRAISPVLVALDLAFGRKDFVGASYFSTLAVILVVVPLQAVAEELFFRGTVLQTAGSFARSPWFAIVASAALFTLAHGVQPQLALGIAPVGLLTGWLAVRTGGLEAGIGYHVALNTLGMAVELAIAHGKRGINENVHYLGAAVSIVFVLTYTIIVARLAKRLPAGADQVDEDPAERRMGIEHADHGGDAEALAPQEEQARG